MDDIIYQNVTQAMPEEEEIKRKDMLAGCIIATKTNGVQRGSESSSSRGLTASNLRHGKCK